MKKKISKIPARKKKRPAAPVAKPAAAKAIAKRDELRFRKRLLIMRDDLTKTVEAKKERDLENPTAGDEADQAAQSLEKEILFELSDNERNMLAQIEASLRKMEKGAYGLCESCRKPITLKRLEALPFARYCIACQGSVEHSAQ